MRSSITKRWWWIQSWIRAILWWTGRLQERVDRLHQNRTKVNTDSCVTIELGERDPPLNGTFPLVPNTGMAWCYTIHRHHIVSLSPAIVYPHWVSYHQLGHIVLIELSQTSTDLPFSTGAVLNHSSDCDSPLHVPWCQLRLSIETPSPSNKRPNKIEARRITLICSLLCWSLLQSFLESNLLCLITVNPTSQKTPRWNTKLVNSPISLPTRSSCANTFSGTAGSGWILSSLQGTKRHLDAEQPTIQDRN